MTNSARHGIELRRVYDPDIGDDACRVLVDRLWPRGVAKADAPIDEWCKDAAPSTGLRRWYGHDVDKFAEFARRYRAELGQIPGSAAVGHLLELAADRGLVLLTATRDVPHSAAHVLRDHLVAVRS